MGSQYAPTFLDILFINKLYGFISECRWEYCSHFSDNCNSSTLACLNGGYADPRNNCTICRCPSGFAGTLCNQLQPATYGNTCNGQIVMATTSVQTFNGYAGDSTLTNLPNLYDCYHQIQVWIDSKILISENMFKCPVGNSVKIQILAVNTFSCYEGCYYGSLELKMGSDLRLTGYRFVSGICIGNDVWYFKGFVVQRMLESQWLVTLI
jgi:hypothetical protein